MNKKCKELHAITMLSKKELMVIPQPTESKWDEIRAYARDIAYCILGVIGLWGGMTSLVFLAGFFQY